MKNLKDTILEKLIINKHSKVKDDTLEKFCKVLYLDNKPANKRKIEILYKYYQNDCNKIIENNFDGSLISTNFELLFMLAVMLLDDNYNISYIRDIGWKSYKGKNNPYDFSWFEEEDGGDNTVLEVIQQLWVDNKDFYDIFSDIYMWTKDTCFDYKSAIDGIWSLQNITG